jgi:hypothetical protein
MAVTTEVGMRSAPGRGTVESQTYRQRPTRCMATGTDPGRVRRSVHRARRRSSADHDSEHEPHPLRHRRPYHLPPGFPGGVATFR